jgi:ethanolamine utilization microcompartment shell protein EutS
VSVIFDSLLRWQPEAQLPAVDQVTAAILAAVPGLAVRCAHAHVGFERVSGDVTLAGAIAAGEAQLVS